ncbi:MAG: hypothetical protein ACFE8B_02375 [Candidatus Hermodarchaeota archaeon]
MIDLIHKNKIRADNYITGFIVLFFLAFALFFRLEWIMSVIVYPFVALFFYGLIKIINGVNKRNRGNDKNLNRILFGTISMIFSLFFLYFIITQPNMEVKNIIVLIAYPMIIVGIAGIVKGSLIDIYSNKYRAINIMIGLATVIVCIIAFASPLLTPSNLIWVHFISLSISLLFNVLGRAALYLSEFDLSLSHLRNFVIFLYIISDYLIFVDHEGNVILEKIK